MFTNFTYDFVLVKYIAKLICFTTVLHICIILLIVYIIMEMCLNYYVLVVFGISPLGFPEDLHGYI